MKYTNTSKSVSGYFDYWANKIPGYYDYWVKYEKKNDKGK